MLNNHVGRGGWLNKYLSEGIILAGLPIIAYIVKFTYDSGYGAFFRIPPTFTSFSLADIFPTIFGVSVALIFIYNMMATNIDIKSEDADPFLTIFQNICLLVFFAAVMWIFYPNTKMRLYFLVLAAYAVVRHFLMPIIWHCKEKGYAAKFKNHLDKTSQRRRTASDYMWDFALFKEALPLIFIVGTISVIYSMGFNSARMQTQYYVLEGKPTMVAVRFVNDNVVLLNIDNGKLGNQIQYRSLVSDKLTLKRITLKPLKGGGSL